MLHPAPTRGVPRDRSRPEQLTADNASVSFFHGINKLKERFSELLFFQSSFFHPLNKPRCSYRAVLAGMAALSLNYTSRPANAEHISIQNRHSASILSVRAAFLLNRLKPILLFSLARGLEKKQPLLVRKPESSPVLCETPPLRS